MTGTLRDTIQKLAGDFAAGVLGVIRGASLEDILAETESVVRRGRGRPPSQANARGLLDPASPAPKLGRKGRLQRRSASDIGQVVSRIVELLSGKPKGLRAEQIRAALGLSAKELPRPIAQALSAQQITKSGQKRATTYFVRGRGVASTTGASGGGSRKAPGKAPGKAPEKSGRKSASKRVTSKAKGTRTEASGRPAEAAASGTAEAT